MQRHCLKSTSTVHAHLKTLEENGYITRDAGLNRAIHIAGGERSVQVPILGQVTAGLPILAVEDVEGYVPLNESQSRGRDLFALRVKGYSMKNAGILDGDIVICQKTPTADNGDIVVALLEDEPLLSAFSERMALSAYSLKTPTLRLSYLSRWSFWGV